MSAKGSPGETWRRLMVGVAALQCVGCADEVGVALVPSLGPVCAQCARVVVELIEIRTFELELELVELQEASARLGWVLEELGVVGSPQGRPA